MKKEKIHSVKTIGIHSALLKIKSINDIIDENKQELKKRA